MAVEDDDERDEMSSMGADRVQLLGVKPQVEVSRVTAAVGCHCYITLLQASSGTSARLRRSILIWLTLQNAVHTLLVRYSRARPVEHMFYPSVAVFCTEAVKLVICIGAVAVECGGLGRALATVYATVVDHPADTAKVGVLSFVFTIQNNLFYLAASHLDAATFMVEWIRCVKEFAAQITSQLKILTTAIFAVIILRKVLHCHQWLALLILFAGVSIVQLQSSAAKAVGDDAPVKSADDLPKIKERTEVPWIGFVAVVAASSLSGFASEFAHSPIPHCRHLL